MEYLADRGATSASSEASGPIAAGGRPLEGTTALVTGASRGIGLAIARSLAASGARLVMVARREEPLRAAAAALGAQAVAADVSVSEEVDRLAGTVRERLAGPAPDVLVNSAGVFGLAPLAATRPEFFDRHIAVNLRAPFLLLRAFVPALLERGRGHVVSIGSVAGRMAYAENGAYSASKFGLRGLHAVLDAELRGTGVRATLVEPAATDTPLWDEIDRDLHPGLPPRESMLRPESVAQAVLFAVTAPPDTDVRNIILDRT